VIGDGIGQSRSIRDNGDEVTALLEVVGSVLLLNFEDDAMGRLRPVGPGEVGNAPSSEQEAEGDQENNQDLRVEMANVATVHRVSLTAGTLK
jgi:hypothetical protein